MRRLKELKIEEVDAFLTQLAEEFNVPKPKYCIYKVECVKKLEQTLVEIKTRRGWSVGRINPFPIGASFTSPVGGELCFITLLLRSNRGISVRNIVHEFFHYLDYVENGYSFCGLEEELEKRVVKRTSQFLKRLKMSRNYADEENAKAVEKRKLIYTRGGHRPAKS